MPGDVLSGSVTATTWRWGDVNNDTAINISDVLRVVDGFLSLFVIRAYPCISDADCMDPIENFPFFKCDIEEGYCVGGTTESLDLINPDPAGNGCFPDRRVDISDVLTAVVSWLGSGFPCSSACP